MNPFQPLGQWLEKNNMTPDEKRRMRTALVHYATTHPIKSGLMSPYTFRFATMAFASLLIVLGGSVGLTTAAGNALPTDKLYPVKIFIEEYRAKNQKTPDDIIAFETKRVETRFDEATRLAVAHQLDDATSAVIQSGIEYSRGKVKSAADEVQSSNPELALSASNKLETAFSSNGKILAAIERNTNQSLGTIVLAAQVTTSKLAMEKTKYEQIVAMKPNDSTKLAAETKLASVEKMVAALPVAEDSSQKPEVVATVTTDATPLEIATTVSTDIALMKADTNAKMLVTEPITADEPVKTEPTKPTAQDLIADAKLKMADGNYSQALVILGQAEQLLNEQNLTASLEEEYKVETVDLNTAKQ